jgi:hypothetical protein
MIRIITTALATFLFASSLQVLAASNLQKPPVAAEPAQVVEIPSQPIIAHTEPVKQPESPREEPKQPEPAEVVDPQNCEPDQYWDREPPYNCIDKPEPVVSVARSEATPVSSGVEQWRHLVEQYKWDVDIAMAVMSAESGGNPNAENLSDVHRDMYGNVICYGSFGLFQISCHGGQIFDPTANVQAAWIKYINAGNSWSPWGAYTSGAYYKYLQ